MNPPLALTVQKAPAQLNPSHEYTPAAFSLVSGQPRTASPSEADAAGALAGTEASGVLAELLVVGSLGEEDEPEQAARGMSKAMVAKKRRYMGCPGDGKAETCNGRGL